MRQAKLGNGNDSFPQFTHGLGLGEQPFFDRLGAPLKNPCSRYVVGNRFLWLCRGQERRKKWKDEVPASGHDKELFFRKWGEISSLGVYPLLCELVKGIVTVPRERHAGSRR